MKIQDDKPKDLGVYYFNKQIKWFGVQIWGPHELKNKSGQWDLILSPIA